MNRPQRVLTVCQGGNVRSVMMRYLFNYKYGLDCLACGWEPNTVETKRMLFDWADMVICMQDGIREKLPEDVQTKAVTWDIGDDVWGLNADLMEVCDSVIQQHLEAQLEEVSEAV